MSRFHTEFLFATDYDPYCHFGIVSAPLAAFLATDIGLGATAGTIGAGVLEGAGLGAATSAFTGGNPLTGALTGGLTGGAVGAAGAAGLGSVGQAAAGAGAGAIGAELTGQNPLTGALTGGAAGLVSGSGLLSGSSGATGAGTASVTSAPATGTAGGTGAASTAPASIAAPTGGPAVDLTATATGGTGPASTNAGVAPSLASASGGTGVSTTDLLGSPDFGGSLVSRSTAPLAPGVVDKITGGGGLSGVESFISKNPGLLLGAGALGANMLFGNKPSHAETQLNQQAGEAASQARVLESYQLTGTLPPGLQSVVDRSQNSAVAHIKSQYAQLGMSGSTAETQAVASAKQESAVQIAKIADDLATQGLRWETLSSQDLENAIRAQELRDQSFTSALTTFAAGLAGAKFGGGTG